MLRDFFNSAATIVARRWPVQQSPDTTAVPASDAAARPRDGRARPQPDGTPARRRCFNGVHRRSHGRSRSVVVGQANAKTHNSWAFRVFIARLACTAEEYGMSVEVRSEAWTSQECPNCGLTEDTTRHRDTFTCLCRFEDHADLTASATFLRRHDDVSRPMEQPVCLKVGRPPMVGVITRLPSQRGQVGEFHSCPL